jgi:hypothetical protein
MMEFVKLDEMFQWIIFFEEDAENFEYLENFRKLYLVGGLYAASVV